MGGVELDSSGSGWHSLVRYFNTGFDPFSGSVELLLDKVAMAQAFSE
jgi:uncharacterized membrane protein YbjE (DUF340 family)